LASNETDIVRLSDIREISAYKRDLFTTDLICCDIENDTKDGRYTRTIHEEMVGFTEVIKELETLDGFYKDWREVVVFPPFQQNYTIIYRRGLDFESIYSDTPSRAQRPSEIEEDGRDSNWPWLVIALLILATIAVTQSYP